MLAVWDEGEAASLHRPFDTRTMLSKKAARMGDKAKPSGVGERRRLCCLKNRVLTWINAPIAIVSF